MPSSTASRSVNGVKSATTANATATADAGLDQHVTEEIVAVDLAARAAMRLVRGFALGHGASLAGFGAQALNAATAPFRSRNERLTLTPLVRICPARVRAQARTRSRTIAPRPALSWLQLLRANASASCSARSLFGPQPHFAYRRAPRTRSTASWFGRASCFRPCQTHPSSPAAGRAAGRRRRQAAGTAKCRGRPARFAVTVKMSLRYMATGSPLFSPSAKAADGVGRRQDRVDLLEGSRNPRDACAPSARAGSRRRNSRPTARRCRSACGACTSLPKPAARVFSYVDQSLPGTRRP
jgi:hypothetical protein